MKELVLTPGTTERLLDELFVYRIGEQVYSADASFNRSSIPHKFTVIGRFLEQCPGGIQRKYQLNGLAGHSHEITLTPEKPVYDASPDFERTKADRVAFQSSGI